MNSVIDYINKLFSNSQAQELAGKSIHLYSAELPFFKIASVLLTIFFISCAVYFSIKTNWLPLRVDRVRDVVLKTNMPKRRSIRAWQKTQAYFFAGDDNSLKLAILEADKILDEALRLAGFRGENLGDRLKKVTEAQLPNIQEVWEAHKLRNRMAHETDFKLDRSTAERALAIYERTFKDLALLD